MPQFQIDDVQLLAISCWQVVNAIPTARDLGNDHTALADLTTSPRSLHHGKTESEQADG